MENSVKIMAAESPTTPASSSLKGILRSLQHRNFRLFFAGQGISLIGTWMQQAAMSWLVYQTTRDALKMGLVNFASQIPGLLLVPVVGVFLDRWNRHRVIIGTQSLAMIQAGLLAVLVLAGVIQFWHLLVLSLFMGCINAFDMPARQAFLPEMLTDKGDLSNAIALNSSLFNGARLVGPALAGFVIELTGAAFCFILNAVSYLAVIIALEAMDIARQPRPTHRPHVLEGLKEGFRYAFGFAPIRALILMVAMVSFLAMPYAVLLPLFADAILHEGANGYGLLMAAAGAGALAGAIYMASRTTVLGLGTRIVAALILVGASLLGFSQSENLWLSMGLLFFTGLGMMITMSACNTILQTIVEDDKRGRVMSLYTLAFMGLSPFGSLLAGSLAASPIGPQTTVLLSGAACLAGALVFARHLPSLRVHIRPIYVKKGILSPPVSNVEPVAEILVSAAAGEADKENGAGSPGGSGLGLTRPTT
jgi:MFS family permease